MITTHLPAFPRLISIQRRPVTRAILLSAVLPGAGQLYNREFIRGTAFILASSWTYMNVCGSCDSFYGFWGLLLFGIWLLSIADAGLTARLKELHVSRQLL